MKSQSFGQMNAVREIEWVAAMGNDLQFNPPNHPTTHSTTQRAPTHSTTLQSTASVTQNENLNLNPESASPTLTSTSTRSLISFPFTLLSAQNRSLFSSFCFVLFSFIFFFQCIFVVVNFSHFAFCWVVFLFYFSAPSAVSECVSVWVG